MERFDNGVPANSISGAQWFKSSESSAVGNCVEVAALPQGDVAVRNSRYPDGPALIYTRDELKAFVAGAKCGEFDHVTV
ncbi:DUF397 domain-containing protein [Streptomyces lunalinharesii]|uniref:DUF397 domain-containing protein n=2 Tax=Streptomyces lunalinharesii TaxID=333384 RepID=A0ABP6F1P7_9ACTN